jgi:hypothetical protein
MWWRSSIISGSTTAISSRRLGVGMGRLLRLELGDRR